MTAFDTNILFPALEPSHADHGAARAFLGRLQAEGGGVLCELVLVETYVLVRNPAICARPLDGPAATALIQTLRRNPRWQLVDYPGGVMEDVWNLSAAPGFARRRVFDARLAVTLLHHGVTEFATRSTSHFEGLGFARVWDPLEG